MEKALEKREPQVEYFRALEIVGEVGELSGPALDRTLAELCAGSSTLESQVRALLTMGSTRHGQLETESGGRVIGFESETIGRVLAEKYVLHERVGAGSMGVVYRGEHVQLGKSVAIKVLRGEIRPSDNYAKRMLDEARANAGIDHENVAAVHDVGIADGAPYMVMDWLDGVDLHRWLHWANSEGFFEAGCPRGRFEEFYASQLQAPLTGSLWSRPYPEIVAYLVMRIARAVEEAHRSGIVHRDIAPKNVMLTGEGRPVLVDFGVATLANPDVPASTRGDVAGTMPYMAPEQLVPGPGSRQEPVDVYSLGASLYHLLSGRLPFEGASVVVALRIATELPPKLESIQPDVPPELAAICFAAMEKRPEDRYPSAAALADDLQAFLDRRPVSRKPPTVFGRVVRWCQRKPMAALACVLFLALSAATGWLARSVHREHQRIEAVQAVEDFRDAYVQVPALATLEPDGTSGRAATPVKAEANLGPILRELIRLEPERPLLRWYLANWASQTGALDEVQEQIAILNEQGHGSPLLELVAERLTSADSVERCGLLSPEEFPTPGADSSFDHAILGYCAHRWREYEMSWSLLSTAIDLEPSEWLYRDLRIIPGMEMGDAYVALDDASKVERALGRETSRTLHARAIAAVYQGESEKARKLWEQALALVPDQHQPLNGIGREHLYAGEYELAQRMLRRAAKLKPSSWNTSILISMCAQELGNFDAAVETIEAEVSKLDDVVHPIGSRRRMDIEFHRIGLLLDWAEHRKHTRDRGGAQRLMRELEEIHAELVKAPELLEPGQLEELTSLNILLRANSGELDSKSAIRMQEEQMALYFSKRYNASRFIATNLGLCLREAGEERQFLTSFFLGFDEHNRSPYSRVTLRDQALTMPEAMEANFDR